MKRAARYALAAMLALVATAPATAQTATAQTATVQSAPGLEVHIAWDTRPRPSVTELVAYHIVTIIDRATGQPPAQPYLVFGQATDQQGETTQFFDCDHGNDLDPRVPQGVYDCSVYVDHGGTWEFVATVNEQRKGSQATVARASAPFVLDTEQVYTGGDPALQIKGSAGSAALLWAHVLAAGAWFASVAALAALALPAIRVRLSSFGLHRLERRLDGLAKLAWSATTAVIGTGVYLLAKETAYDAPLSSSEIDAVFSLPYARPYFLALAAKIAFYALMVLAMVPLVRGARRQLHAGPGTAGSLAEGELRSSPVAGLAVFVVLFGGLGISLFVTLLKYFHQLIEATG